MVAACKYTGPIWKEPEAGIAEKQEDSHHLLQTKETKEGRTLYYAAVQVSFTIIPHSTWTTPHLNEHFLLWPWPWPPEAQSAIKQPWTMSDYWNIAPTFVTIQVASL